MENKGLMQPCLCVPQELEKQYRPSRWVIRRGAEEALKMYSHRGDQGTGTVPMAAVGGLWQVAMVQIAGSRRRLSGQFPKSRHWANLVSSGPLRALTAGWLEPGSGPPRHDPPLLRAQPDML